MAALLEMIRDFQTYPALSKKEQATLYGTYRPTIRRASLAAAQRNGAVKPMAKAASIADTQNGDAQIGRSDDLDEQDISARKRGRSNATQGTYQSQGVEFPWRVLFLGISIPVGIYTILFLVVAGWVSLTNTLSYGPTHTAYTSALINGQASTIQTSTINGSIYVTIINNKDGTAKVYSGPSLDPHAWNDDMSGIVVTAEVGKDQPTPTITIHVIGSITYLHLFFVRPQMTFLLVPDKQAGYSVAPSS